MTAGPVEPAGDDERTLLLGWLEFHRGALQRKCAGLSAAQLCLRSVPPSTMSLIGLVRHLTEMERFYFGYSIGGGSPDLRYCNDANPDGDFDGLNEADVAPSIAAWEADRVRADELIAATDVDAPGRGSAHSLRWNLLKMIEEYARHNGHADLLRESIDGAVGE